MVLYKSPNTEGWLNDVLGGRLLEEQFDKIKIIWIKALLFHRKNIVFEVACHEKVIVFNGEPTEIDCSFKKGLVRHLRIQRDCIKQEESSHFRLKIKLSKRITVGMFNPDYSPTSKIDYRERF